MKKGILLLALFPLLLINGCGLFGKNNDPPPDTPQIITRKTVENEKAKEQSTNDATASTDNAEEATPDNTGTSPADPAIQSTNKEKKKYPIFEYPYTIADDRQNFDYNNVDIVVGDKRYMTQINDWYMNFRDYKNKTVIIEGYYLAINGHHFVGRNGPTCPYCTGGYVDFEFTSDQDFSGYEPASTWIRVYGILREATVRLNDHVTAPFYHLEAVKVEKMPQEGIGTIVD